jgi:hypothetical protein
LPRAAERSELLHTSSAKSAPVWAGVACSGRISKSRTVTPRRASCQQPRSRPTRPRSRERAAPARAIAWAAQSNACGAWWASPNDPEPPVALLCHDALELEHHQLPRHPHHAPASPAASSSRVEGSSRSAATIGCARHAASCACPDPHASRRSAAVAGPSRSPRARRSRRARARHPPGAAGLGPSLVGAPTAPGTAITSRPWSAAWRAVTSEPLFARASTTTTARASALINRLRAGSGSAAAALRAGARPRSAPRLGDLVGERAVFRGIHLIRAAALDRDGDAARRARAPGASAASMPRASPETTPMPHPARSRPSANARSRPSRVAWRAPTIATNGTPSAAGSPRTARTGAASASSARRAGYAALPNGTRRTPSRASAARSCAKAGGGSTAAGLAAPSAASPASAPRPRERRLGARRCVRRAALQREPRMQRRDRRGCVVARIDDSDRASGRLGSDMSRLPGPGPTPK